MDVVQAVLSDPNPTHTAMIKLLKSMFQRQTSASEEEPPSFSQHSTAHLAFGSEDTKRLLHALTDRELNALPFGVIKVDDSGVILFYNKYESELASVPVHEALGKNFFTQLAPCSNSRLFYGYFKEGIVAGSMDKSYMYTFSYKMRPTLVRVHLYKDRMNNNWVMIQKC